ncbi:hypothetical protein NUW58_g7497 [Xylaria curta]|uniref:Uncharacterized protein n=1 Tax=Xylaria curta TaxID=42375 RepID=A0ACC1NHU7_9PEZI|nr:hypothetical protein NUW58_g7497 [Xylaria curta]
MSSRSSSAGYGSGGFNSNYSTVVSQDICRAFKSRDYQAERTERVTSHGDRSVVYNHKARGYESGAPTPRYDASTYGRK